MRRLLPLLALAVFLPLGSASASTCAEPQDEPAQCCPPQYLIEIDNGIVYLAVPDPLVRPCLYPV